MVVLSWTVLDFAHGTYDYFDVVGVGPGAFFVVLFFPAQILRAIRDLRTGGGVEPMPPLAPRN